MLLTAIKTNVEKLRQMFLYEFSMNNFVIDRSGCKTIEILGAQFVANKPWIFGAPDKKYIDNEIMWYLSQDRNVNNIPGGPPKEWTKSASKDGYVNSNYGWCIFNSDNAFQYRNVLEELRQNKDSRRAVMIYNRPSMWWDYNMGGRNDFMCTNDVQYLIRDDILYCIVNMRSNDAIFGYRNDFAWQKYVYNKIWRDLSDKYPSLDRAPLIWNAGSLHIYERHFYYLVHFAKTGETTVNKQEILEYKERFK